MTYLGMDALGCKLSLAFKFETGAVVEFGLICFTVAFYVYSV